jgi:hypothetical protein
MTRAELLYENKLDKPTEENKNGYATAKMLGQPAK